MEIKDYAVIEIFAFLSAILFASVASAVAKLELWCLEWRLFRLMNFIAINFIVYINKL